MNIVCDCQCLVSVLSDVSLVPFRQGYVEFCHELYAFIVFRQNCYLDPVHSGIGGMIIIKLSTAIFFLNELLDIE